MTLNLLYSQIYDYTNSHTTSKSLCIDENIRECAIEIVESSTGVQNIFAQDGWGIVYIL